MRDWKINLQGFYFLFFIFLRKWSFFVITPFTDIHDGEKDASLK
jgi:hypothetical protein